MLFQAIVLGLVQGLTEFLPVSSSGHLVIVPYLFGWQQPPLAFDVALHFGTLLAVMAYFAGDLYYLASRSLGRGGAAERSRARRTVLLLAVGTVPAAVFGYTAENLFAPTLEDPRYAAGFLLVTGGLLLFAERIRRKRAVEELGLEPGTVAPSTDTGRDESTVNYLDASTIGIGQALAIFPGISRSGATIVAGMLRGMSREASARFSFLLSIPIILGATVFKLEDLIGSNADRTFSGLETLAGVAVAALSGFWAIRFLLRLVARQDLTGFARWVILVGVFTLVGYLWLGPPSTI